MTEITQNQLAQLQESVSIEQIQLSEKVGVLKATSFFKKLLTVSEIKFLSEIKESKQYKGLKVLNDDGKLLTVSSWAEFCDSLNKSHQHIDEDIRNLGVFGEDFLETSQRMSLGYRDLRKLRKLDTDDREVIINGEAVKTEDRESLIDLIEEMSAKHAKEKLERDSKITELTSDKEALETIVSKKDEKINQLDTQVTKLSTPAEIAKKQDTEQQQLTSSALDTLHAACLTMHNDVVRFTNGINSIQAAIEEHGLYSIQEQLEANVVAAFQQIAQISVELGIQIDFKEMVNPSWMPTTESDVPHFDATDVEQ